MPHPVKRRRLIACAAALGVVAAFLAVRGLSIRDLIALVTDKAARAASDTRALLNGETTERVARELRNEAAKMSSEAEAARGRPLTELERELAAERKRILEARAAALQQNTGKLLEGDLEGLKRQVLENARQAGGTE